MSSRRTATRWLILGALALTMPACVKRVDGGGPGGTEGPEGRSRIEMDTYRVSTEPDPQLGDNIWNAERLFHAGEERYDAREYAAAAELLGRVVEEFPESRFVAPALLLRGMSELELKRFEASIPWFERYLKEYPAGTQRWFAYRGLGEANAGLKRWDASQKDFETLLALPDLTPSQRDAGRARVARALVEQGRLDEGAKLLEEVIKRHGPLARTPDGFSEGTDTGALTRFYIGEVARLRSEAIVLQDAVELSRAEDDLERKADLLLEAHQEYFRTFAYDNPFWTAAAAYRMGYLYEKFYQDLLNSPTPQGLSKEDTEIYREAMDEQLVNVVKRAYDLYQQVLRNAERLGLDEAYVEQCRAGIARLEDRIKRIAPAATKQGTEGSGNGGAEGSSQPAGAQEPAAPPRNPPAPPEPSDSATGRKSRL